MSGWLGIWKRRQRHRGYRRSQQRVSRCTICLCGFVASTVKENMRRLCVFCGSSFGVRPIYGETARELGALLADRGISLVYGGAKVGLMGAIAAAVLEPRGEVIGAMPQQLLEKEIAHPGPTELRVVKSM